MSQLADNLTVRAAQAMLSQRGKEILARRPPLFNDNSSLDRNSSSDCLERNPQSGCESYVVELPAHEIEEVAVSSHRGESYRTSRHSFMAISSAILLSVAAIVLLALDSGNVQDLSSAVLLSGSKHATTASKLSIAVNTVHPAVASLKQSSSTPKQNLDPPLNNAIQKAASASVNDDTPKEDHNDAKSILQKPIKHKIPNAEAKSLRAAARSKAGAALFARAVRSTEMALAHPSGLANRMQSLQSASLPTQAPSLASKAPGVQRAQYKQYPAYPAYSVPPASYQYSYRPAAVPLSYPTAQQGEYYPNSYRQQAYVRPAQYPYSYPVQANMQPLPAQPYATGPSVGAYGQPRANVANPSAAYTSLKSAPAQSILPPRQGMEQSYPGQPPRYSQPQAKYSQPTAVMPQQPFQPVVGLYNPEEAPQPAQLPPGPVLKGTWQYPTYAPPQQAAAQPYAASPMLAGQPGNFAPSTQYIQTASQQVEPQVQQQPALQPRPSGQQQPQAALSAPQPPSQAQLQPQPAPAVPPSPAELEPMMVDGAAADTESLEHQAAETASRALGASLGSDSPYLSSLRQHLQQEMLQTEEASSGGPALANVAIPQQAQAGAGADEAEGPSADIRESANPYITRMGFMAE